MRPYEAAIKATLRREAARAPIPENMWAKIEQQLDQARPVKPALHVLPAPAAPPVFPRRMLQWRSAVGLVAAAAMVGLTFAMPTPRHGELASFTPTVLRSPLRGPFQNDIDMKLSGRERGWQRGSQPDLLSGRSPL